MRRELTVSEKTAGCQEIFAVTGVPTLYFYAIGYLLPQRHL